MENRTIKEEAILVRIDLNILEIISEIKQLCY